MRCAAELVAEVRALGFEIECKGPNLQLIGVGDLDGGLREQLRARKQDVLLYLRHGIEWGPWRTLGAHLGKTVVVDGREVTLWGVTARGPIVDMGSFVIAVDVSEIEVPKDDP